MRGRRPLVKVEIGAKVLDLVELFEMKGLAEKLSVHLSTVYRWTSTYYSVHPNPIHKRRILRLWYYHICFHRGDRKNPVRERSKQLNPVTQAGKEGVAVHA